MENSQHLLLITIVVVLIFIILTLLLIYIDKYDTNQNVKNYFYFHPLNPNVRKHPYRRALLFGNN